MRILIDSNSIVLRTGASHLSGIGRTTLELIHALDALDYPDMDFHLLTQTFRGKIPQQFSNIKSSNMLWPIGKRFDWLKQKSSLLEIFSPHDLLHIPHNFSEVHRPEQTVATIHDAIYFSHPEEALGHAEARLRFPRFAKAIRAIATPSLSAKEDIVHYLGIQPKKVTVIPWGVNRLIFNTDIKLNAKARVVATLNTNRPYFLAVSCSRGRKNTISVLKAFRAAMRRGFEHTLVLVWGHPPQDYLDMFASEITDQRIIFVHHVSDSVLADLYAGATASFFPSRYEGFGLPILESLACATPVVTCRNSSLVEVGGDVATYVDPDDLDGMTDLMRIFDSGSKSGWPNEVDYLAQVEKFSWQSTARQYLEFYNRQAGDLS